MAAKRTGAWERGLLGVNILAGLCLPALVVLTGIAWQRAIALRNPVPPAQPPPQASNPSAAKNNSTQDKAAEQETFKQRADALQKQVQSEEETFRQRADDQQRLISALTALTGIYTLVVGAASFLSLQQIRDKAKQEITSVQDNLNALREEVRRDVPALHSLQTRLVRLAYELEGKLPSEKNWNSYESYAALSEKERQEILLGEVTIDALSVFGLDRLTENRDVVTGLYLSLARFYSTRSHSSAPRNRQDVERAYIYLDRAVGINPQSAISYRMRAVYKLDDAEEAKTRADAAAAASDIAELDLQLAAYKSILEEVERLLLKSKACDENDAGSYYNLAYLYNRREEMPKCVRELRQLIAREHTLPEVQRGKYLPSAYINLACCTMRESDEAAASGDLEKAKLLAEGALNLLRNGRNKAETYLALKVFRAELESETKPPKDELQTLMNAYRDRTSSLLK